MEYFLQVAYSFFTTITCFDSPLSIHLNGVKSMEILMVLIATYYFNIIVLLMLCLLLIRA